MRRLLVVAAACSAVGYAAVALWLYQQEQWARSPKSIPADAFRELRHPEAILGALRTRFEVQGYGADELELAAAALGAAPSFYQSPYYVATYFSARLERPELVREAFEQALLRYPANGRLHVAYGRWLLVSRGSLSGWRSAEGATALEDPLPRAEHHLERGMALEPELAAEAFRALAAHRIPPGRWVDLAPDEKQVRRQLIDVLFAAGHVEAGVAMLGALVEETADGSELARATVLALDADRPELALAAGRKWQRDAPRDKKFEAAVWVSRAHLALRQFELAEQVLEQALESIEAETGPSSRASLEAYSRAGYEYLNRGHALAAESLFAQALSRNPGHLPALLGIAESLERSWPEDAIVRYEEALRLDPANERARRRLGQLLRRGAAP